MPTTIKLKRGTAARWAEVNPVLALGEPGFVYDTNKIKVGDGSTPWNQLPYLESAAEIESKSSYVDLPVIGDPSIIYRVIDEKTLYQYNTVTKSYEAISGNIENINLINGGNA